MGHTAIVRTFALLIAFCSSSNALAGQACIREQSAVAKLSRDVGMLEGRVTRAEDSLATRQEQGDLRLASLSASVANAQATASAAAANAAGRGLGCALNGGRCLGNTAAQFIAAAARAKAQVRAAQRRYDAFAQALQRQIQRLSERITNDRKTLTQKRIDLDRAQEALTQCAEKQTS